jgi:hypothetical protein
LATISVDQPSGSGAATPSGGGGVQGKLYAFLIAIPHSFALGSLPWLMMSEIFPTRIRARAVAITTTFIWAVCFLAQYLFPVIAGLSKRILGSIGGAFWFSAAICVLAFFFGLWLLPETKGRTLEQIAEAWKTGRRA